MKRWVRFGRANPSLAKNRVSDDQLLLNQAHRLNPEALAQIHDRYYGPIFRYIAFRLGNPDLAEDLTSEVFVRFLHALRQPSAPQNSLKGWLYGVASRIVADHFRQLYRHPEQQLLETAASPDDDPADSADQTITWQALGAALNELTADQRQALALRFGDELSIREAAQVMGKSEGSIKQLQARAVAALTRRLSPGREG
jgi:RNA polymerase sigma-70 factor, ECF subfamily